jgi:hypothetical protein
MFESYMTDTLIVNEWRRSRNRDLPSITASIGGFPVEFRGAGLANAPDRGDAYLAVGLLPAMAAGVTLDLRDLPPVSGELLASLDEIQEIWTTWNPELKKIAVRCASTSEPVVSTGTAVCFSGGADAVHAALSYAESDATLVYVGGFDFDMSADALAVAVARVQPLADRLERRLEAVATDWIRFTRHRRLSRPLTHGGCLVAIGHLMATTQLTIASSNTWARLNPWGTHPLLDPLWSTEAIAIRHRGNEATRLEKVAAIARDQALLQKLWVCPYSPSENCGTCEKCLRTRAILHVIGRPAVAFPNGDQDPMPEYARQATSVVEKMYLSEMLRFTESSGKAEMSAIIIKLIRKTERHEVFRRVKAAVPLLPRIRRRFDPIDLRPWGYGGTPS